MAHMGTIQFYAEQMILSPFQPMVDHFQVFSGGFVVKEKIVL